MSGWNSSRLLQHLKTIIVIIFMVIGLYILFLLVLNRCSIKIERMGSYYIGNVAFLCIGIVLHESGHIVASLISHAKVEEIKITKGVLPKITVVLNTAEGIARINRLFVIAGGIFFPIYICYAVTLFSSKMIINMDIFLLITAINMIPISDTDGNKIKRIIFEK